MNDLVGLLQQIASLSEASFAPGASNKTRARELSLLDNVLPPMSSASGPRIVRSCSRSPRTLSMHYQVRSGKFSDVVISYDRASEEISMIMNGVKVPAPQSKDDLSRFLQTLIVGAGP